MLGAEIASAPELLGCVGHVCPSVRERALARIRALRLPLAIIGGDLMYSVGAAHPAPASFNQQGKSLAQDCTHWCAPGINDVLVSIITNLVLRYDGNRTAFVAAMDAAGTTGRREAPQGSRRRRALQGRTRAISKGCKHL
jgi:hypothetical protein